MADTGDSEGIFTGSHIERVIEAPAKAVDSEITHPSVSDYTCRNQVASADDPDRYFDDSEYRTAEIIRGHGHTVLSVAVGRGKSADAILDGTTPFDIKRVSTPTARAIEGAVRRAKGQAAIAFLDATDTEIDETMAVEAIKTAARNRGHYLRQIVLALTPTRWVSWWRE